jgi:hypothetical protein
MILNNPTPILDALVLAFACQGLAAAEFHAAPAGNDAGRP